MVAEEFRSPAPPFLERTLFATLQLIRHKTCVLLARGNFRLAVWEWSECYYRVPGRFSLHSTRTLH